MRRQEIINLWNQAISHNYLFVMAEATHSIGLLILLYKFNTLNTCSGNLISLVNFKIFFYRSGKINSLYFSIFGLVYLIRIFLIISRFLRESGKICIHFILLHIHLWDFTEYVVVVVWKSVYRDLIGLSLNSQVLTFIFLGVRLYCSFIMERDIHTSFIYIWRSSS